MGLNPKLFDNPTKFRPERFDLDNVLEKKNNFSYLPFSAGPRNCIGQKFAMLDMKSVISKLLRHYRLELADEEKLAEPVIAVEVILKPINGINFHLIPRQ